MPEKEGDRINLSIEDNGQGISEETKRNSIRLSSRQNRSVKAPVSDCRSLNRLSNKNITVRSEWIHTPANIPVLLFLFLSNNNRDKSHGYKILSVDDELDLERLLTQYFRRKIKKGEYEFYFAHNGLEALQLMLVQPDFDVILSDINMPEMDGLTLLAKINEMQNPALKCIMVSAYGDMDNIRSAMNQGAFDFTTKPINLEDLERTIEKQPNKYHSSKSTAGAFATGIHP